MHTYTSPTGTWIIPDTSPTGTTDTSRRLLAPTQVIAFEILCLFVFIYCADVCTSSDRDDMRLHCLFFSVLASPFRSPPLPHQSQSFDRSSRLFFDRHSLFWWCSQRWYNATEFQTNLVPYLRLHLVLASYTVLLSFLPKRLTTYSCLLLRLPTLPPSTLMPLPSSPLGVGFLCSCRKGLCTII